MEIISGLKQMCLETTAMWENSTVLPDYWLVSACVYPARCESSVQPPALTLLFVLFGVECDLYIAPGFSLLCYTECLYSCMLPRTPAQCLLLSTSFCININN